MTFAQLPPHLWRGLFIDFIYSDGRREHVHYRILKSGDWKSWEPKRCRVHKTCRRLGTSIDCEPACTRTCVA